MEKMTMLEMRKCNLLHWALINAVTALGKLEDQWPEFPADGKWELTLTMSGVELPIMETFKQLENSIDDMVKDKAKEIVDDHFTDLFSAVEETLEEVTDKLKEKMAGLITEKCDD